MHPLNIFNNQNLNTQNHYKLLVTQTLDLVYQSQQFTALLTLCLTNNIMSNATY